MAAEIAKCLPGTLKRKDGYFETDGGLVTWAYGHILRQAEPNEYDKKYEKWIVEDLPIIPEKWKLCVADSCKKQFNVIKDLIGSASAIVHAGDPDREGQLLIDEILDYVKNKKPVYRILLNALDEKSIKKALSDLKDNKKFLNLQQSALARSRADWLVGMNASRAYTLAARKAGHSVTLPIGRVKTPTLALVVRREEDIKNFKPITYYVLKATFLSQNGKLDTVWQPQENQSGMDLEGRLIDKYIADALVKGFRLKKEEGQLAVIDNVATEKKTIPQCLPFSLSALQLQAGKMFGYDPQTVLDTAQILYEKKLTTYPRSDCDFLPENQWEDAKDILQNLMNIDNGEIAGWVTGANSSLKSRAWNDKKITAHHAIIPTETLCKYSDLPEKERNIYMLVARAYIAQFYPAHEYEHTKVTISFADESFETSGNVILNDGWKCLYRRSSDIEEEHSEENKSLPSVVKGSTAEYLVAYPEESKTKPPKRFTPSTLLQAMKEIHKYVKNPDLKKQLKDVSGIGTEATRASIIKDIIDKGFLKEEKKFLVPTDQAYLIISVLPDELTYPDATAEWEMNFSLMEEGKVKLEDFIDKQSLFVTDLCIKSVGMEIVEAQGHTCPTCEKGVLRTRKGTKGVFWGCNRYPDCKATFPDKKGKPDMEPPKEFDCPECEKGKLRQRNGSKGKFWGCSNYPACKAIYSDSRGKPQMISCPSCKQGILRKRKGKNGDFWGCNKYPDCSSTFPDEKGKPKFEK